MSKRDSRRELPPVPEALPASAVDAHTHLDACGASTAEDVRAIVDRAQAAGVGRVVTVADDIGSARWAAEASTWDDRVFAAVALHPTRTKDFDDADREALEELSRHPRVVAVGETGLDYYWDYSPPEPQQEAFRWHIDLAKRVGKPLMIHDREAHEDILRILEEEGAPSTVVFHCFSGDADFARRCVDAGYVLSFAGTATFRNARALHEAARLVPAGQMLVETDAPFLTPHPYRGRPNEPYCANYTLRALAELRGVSVEELVVATTETAERTFRLGEVAQNRSNQVGAGGTGSL
ncbi:TatD DNase family protein [Saccharopolyspora erythraea NRRL 2338]|uniref:Deoxyribonuclease n=2 Tax=Saccharopolyspora erythraea TaxID=1836 RepID=A4F7W7_SACEN|nr:TatD family hydrolase [Saccharopolyspora erythraea]EQD85144.1 DNAase [Saccharopolyspora erythraea D]PFG93938.1 TatD DNase family protein [Saccharopolyspora erythraea NRRL 2338]QRK90761.1 TatD family hydrolase [Saccharopolyspora erythraea]CAM00141.1 putative deoxyribonuclease [Saccharopolyspora erythraea NRRL 2338]